MKQQRHLPEPGVPVFIWSQRQGSSPALAHLGWNKNHFIYLNHDLRVIDVQLVDTWDYAVPAGDLL